MKKLFLTVSIILVATAWLLLYFLPQEMRFRPPYPISQTPADVGLNFESFTLNPEDEQLTLSAWWMPAENPRATLAFIHGGGSNRHSEFFKSLDFYAAMVARDISVAVVDLRNHGDSDSDGKGLQFGRTEKWDALALIEWAGKKSPNTPLYAMGISMGGATLIHAANEGAAVDGLILLDPLLDTYDVITQSVWVETGMPPGLFRTAAWAAVEWHGMPGGNDQARVIAASLDQPTLLLQDPDDPVTRAPFARELAKQNPAIRYWEVPSVGEEAIPELQWRGRWGSHVTGFVLFPELVLEQILAFMGLSP